MATCAHCSEPTAGNSKYCREHRAEARYAWKEHVERDKAERADRYAEYAALVRKAHEAGMAAGNGITPTPMVVRPGAITVNGKPVSDQTYYVPEGACGFAWIKVTPGNSSFAIWAKKQGLFDKAYGGGVQYWVGEFGQSVDRKAAFAGAYARVLQEAGIQAYAQSRLD